MKTVTLLVILGCVFGALSGPCCNTSCKYTDGHSGRLSCPAATSGGKLLYRNNNDPTAYWDCTGVASGQPAKAARCQTEFLFLESDQKCVCLTDWVWTPNCDPENFLEDEDNGAGVGGGIGGCGGSGGSGTGGGVAGCTGCGCGK